MRTRGRSTAMMSAQRSGGATSSACASGRSSISRRTRTVNDSAPAFAITAPPTIPVAPMSSASDMRQRGGHLIASEDFGIAVDGEAVGHAGYIVTDMAHCRAFFARHPRRPVGAHQARIVGIGGEEPGDDLVRRLGRCDLFGVMIEIGVHEALEIALLARQFT